MRSVRQRQDGAQTGEGAPGNGQTAAAPPDTADAADAAGAAGVDEVTPAPPAPAPAAPSVPSEPAQPGLQDADEQAPTAPGPAHQRRPETHTAELASQTAATIVRRIPSLSTDELGRLYEHEQETRQRKTVLRAVERALTPDPEA